MRPNTLFLIIFGLLSVVFLLGNVLHKQEWLDYSNFLLIPSVLGFYFSKAKGIKIPVVVAFLCFYIRDIVLLQGFVEYPFFNYGAFYVSVIILLIYAVTEFKKTKISIPEYFSFFIIYGFSIFLFFSLAEIVEEVLPVYAIPTYIYLLLICLFLSISFTVYFLKSHLASLWLMLCASSIAFSEACYFIKLFIIEDFSVSLFYSLFHVFMYFSLAMFALNRRQKKNLPFF